MSESREFSTMGLIGVTSGILLVEGGMDEVVEIMSFVMGQPLMTHQLPTVQPIVKTFIEVQHPWMEAIVFTEDESVERKVKRAELAAKRFGERLSIINMDGAPRVPFHAGLENLGRGRA